MTTAEIMDAMKYDGALVTIERLKVRAERLERDREALLSAAKRMVGFTNYADYETATLYRAAIIQAEAA